MGMSIEEFEMSKSCVTCKHHLFNEVDEHFYCVLKKHNVNCSEYSEWVSDEQMRMTIDKLKENKE